MEEQQYFKAKVIYIGDPMCAYSYGMASEIKKLRDFAVKNNYFFEMIMGGLAPEGGKPWSAKLIEDTKTQWQEVQKETNKPFAYNLFESDKFDFCSEPACRAVVTFRELNPVLELEFFEEIQHAFFVENRDPKKNKFYKAICRKLNVDFDEFLEMFSSDEGLEETNNEFLLTREWGVESYPSILFERNGRLEYVSLGFTTFEFLRDKLLER